MSIGDRGIVHRCVGHGSIARGSIFRGVGGKQGSSAGRMKGREGDDCAGRSEDGWSDTERSIHVQSGLSHQVLPFRENGSRSEEEKHGADVRAQPDAADRNVGCPDFTVDGRGRRAQLTSDVDRKRTYGQGAHAHTEEGPSPG
jgi:hypothetical protein